MSQGDVHVQNVYEGRLASRDEILASEDVGQVRVQMERLDKLAAMLAEEIDALTSQLQAVTRPEATLASGVPRDGAEPLRSPLAAGLASTADGFQARIDRLSDLRRALDL